MESSRSMRRGVAMESLIGKLMHTALEVRQRSTKNVLFKCTNDLMDEVFSCPISSELLLQAVSESLKLSVRDICDCQTVSRSRPVELQLERLISLISHIFMKISKQSLVNECIDTIQSELRTVLASEKISQGLRNKAEIIIQDLEGQKSAGAMHYNESNSECIPYPQSVGAFPTLSRQEEAKTSDNFSSHSNSRAGCIIYSELVQRGFCFPDFVLTESDEKVLFDVEVKLKLGHSDAGLKTLDILEEFPPSAILQRIGLLESFLDIAGSASVIVHKDSCCDELTQIFALKWLRTLLLKCDNLLRKTFDGTLCSHAPLRKGDDCSLSEKMDYELQSMRDPLHTSSVLSEKTKKPYPSLSGIAFAIAAATLPLIEASNPEISAETFKILREAIPFVYDHSLEISSDEFDKKCNILRLQHLMSRIDQVISRHEKLSISHIPLRRHNLDSREGVFRSSFAICISKIVQLLAVLMDNIVDGDLTLCLESDKDTGATSPFRLSIGPSLLNYIKSMYMDEHLSEIASMETLHRILEHLDPLFLDNVQRNSIAKACCSSLLDNDTWLDAKCVYANLYTLCGYLRDVGDIGSSIAVNISRDEIADPREISPLAVFGASVVALLSLVDVSVGTTRHQSEVLFESVMTTTGKVDMSSPVKSSLLLFLGLKEPSSDFEKEVRLVHEKVCYALCTNNHSASKVNSEKILLCASRLSFLCPFLVNVVMPCCGCLSRLNDELPSIRFVCEAIQRSFKPDNFRYSLDSEEDVELLTLLVFNLHLLLWKLRDDSPDAEMELSLYDSLLTLKNYCIALSYDTFLKVFMKAYCAGLFSKCASVRVSCFAELGSLNVLRESTYVENGLLVRNESASSTADDSKSKTTLRSHLKDHATLNRLLQVALGNDDKSICLSALKQLTLMIIKDTNLLMSMEHNSILQCAAELNTKILNGIASASSGVSDTNQEAFLAHCMVLFRTILIAAPDLLSRIIVFPVDSDDEKRDLVAPYILQYACMCLSSEWNSHVNRPSFALFAMCCLETLEVWALNPIGYRNVPFSVFCDSDIASLPCRHLSRPSYCNSEFLQPNFSMLDADSTQKFCLPAKFASCSYSLLKTPHCSPIIESSPHLSCIEDIKPNRCNAFGKTRAQCSAAHRSWLTGYAESLRDLSSQSNDNKSFDDVLHACTIGIVSVDCFRDRLSKAGFTSCLWRILEVFPETIEDIATLGNTLTFLKTYFFFDNGKMYFEHACAVDEMLHLIKSFSGTLRPFLNMKRGCESKRSIIWDSCTCDSLNLLSQIFTALRGTHHNARGTCSDFVSLLPLLLGAFADQIQLSPRVQTALSKCVRSLLSWGSCLDTSIYSVKTLLTWRTGDEEKNVIDDLTNAIQRVRNPGSMVGSCSVACSLAIVVAVMRLDSLHDFYDWKSFEMSSLLRLIRDRNAIIRFCALEALRLKCIAHLARDSRNLEFQIGSVSDSLRTVASDDSEALALRFKATQILIDMVKLNRLTDSMDTIRFILTVISSFLENRHSFPSLDLFFWSSSFLLSISKYTRSHSQDFRGAISNLVSTLKIVPKMCTVFQPDYLNFINRFVCKKVKGVDDAQCKLTGAWKNAQTAHLNCQAKRLRSVLSISLSYLLEEFTSSPDIFRSCIAHSNIFRDVILFMARLARSCSGDTETCIPTELDSLVYAITSCSEFVSFVCIQNNVSSSVSGRNTFGAVDDSINDPTVMLSEIMFALHRYLSLSIELVKSEQGAQHARLRDRMTLSLLRLLLLLLGKDSWAWADLEWLGSLDGSKEHSSLDVALFHVLIDIICVYSGLPRSEAVVDAAFYALGSMMQNSQKLRKMYHQLELRDDTLASETIDLEKCDQDAEKKRRVSSLAINRICSLQQNCGTIIQTDLDKNHPLQCIKKIALTKKSRCTERRRRVKRIERGEVESIDVSSYAQSFVMSAVVFFSGAYGRDLNSGPLDEKTAGTMMNALRHVSAVSSVSQETFPMSLNHLPMSLILTAIVSCASQSPSSRRAFFQSAGSRASTSLSLPSKENSGEGLLPDRLLQLALQQNNSTANRLLSLRLLECFMRDKDLVSLPARRAALHKKIVVALNDTLRWPSKKNLHADISSGLIDVLGSVLLSHSAACKSDAQDGAVEDKSRRWSSEYQSYVVHIDQSVPLSEVLRWSFQNQCSHPRILLSTVRLIGRMCFEDTLQYNINQYDSRKFFALVSSGEVMNALLKCTRCEHALIKQMVYRALWVMLHKSERTRSHVKHSEDNVELLNFHTDGDEMLLMDKQALMLLLSS